MCATTNRTPVRDEAPLSLYRVAKGGESWEVRLPAHVAVALQETGHTVALRVQPPR